MSLSENLQRLRKESGLSQEDVANKLFVSRQSVSKWENGAAEPGVESLKVLAELYGVTLDELTGDGQETAEENGPTPWPWPDVPKPGTRPVPRPPQDFSEENYQALVVFRLVITLVTAIYTASVSGTVSIPLALLLMILGVWARDPLMWGAILAVTAFDAVSWLIWAFLADGGRGLYLVNAAVSAVFLALMVLPSVRRRFFKR